MFNPLSSTPFPEPLAKAVQFRSSRRLTLSESDCSFFISLCIVFKIRAVRLTAGVSISKNRGFVNTFLHVFLKYYILYLLLPQRAPEQLHIVFLKIIITSGALLFNPFSSLRIDVFPRFGHLLFCFRAI